ncbi:MAG: hypothetical protein Kow00109_28010 [Acidobacteriota bacterium]
MRTGWFKVLALTGLLGLCAYAPLGSGAQGLGRTGVFRWEQMRGATAGTDLTEADIEAFARIGGKLLRVGFAARPLMRLTEPYDFDEGAFAYLEDVLDWCEPRGIRVLVDPHRFPGTQHPWTMLGNDPFWFDDKWHELAERLWSEVARRLADRGAVVAGYDLLNQPEVPIPMEVDTPRDLNRLYARLIRAIRRYDRRHTIVLAAPRFVADGRMQPYHKGLAYLEIPDDPNVIFTTHSYNPMEFTHQGVGYADDPPVTYPGWIGGEWWDKDRIAADHAPVVEFVRTTGRHVLIGEFSCPRWTGESGNRWLRDIIDVAEENGWSWAYHAWREASIWDAEKSNFDRNDERRYDTTPRLELLRQYYLRNWEPPERRRLKIFRTLDRRSQ